MGDLKFTRLDLQTCLHKYIVKESWVENKALKLEWRKPRGGRPLNNCGKEHSTCLFHRYVKSGVEELWTSVILSYHFSTCSEKVKSDEHL